jgi:hypothetical protein
MEHGLHGMKKDFTDEALKEVMLVCRKQLNADPHITFF